MIERRRQRRDFFRLLGCARPHGWKLSRAIAAAVGVALLTPIPPLIVRAVIDKGIRLHDARLIAELIGLLLGLGLVKAVFFGARRQLAGEVSADVEAELRDQLYEHVQALDLGYHERVSTGQLMSRASSDLQNIRQLFMMLPWSFTLMLTVAGVMAIIFRLDAPLAGLAVATLPLMGLSTHRFVRRFDPVIWRLQQKLADLASVVEESVTGVRVVKAFGREDHQVRTLAAEADGIYREAMSSIRLRSEFVPLVNFLPQIGIATVLFFGGRRVLTGHITLGTLVAFTSYLMMLTWPLRNLGMIAAAAQRATTAAGRVFDVLDTPPGIADRPGATKLEIGRGTVRFEDVRFAYGSRLVLDGVDLGIPGGSSLALVGPTGCGKSTLVRLLPRFIEPLSGRVTIDGQDVADLTLRSLRSKIGIVFEDTFLFSDTVRANIAFGRPDAEMDEVVRAAVLAQAHGFIEELPHNYDSVVGEQGYSLSGGQRQRVAIARAILLSPPLLILDDATSNVDARMEAAIRDGLVGAMKERTTVIVSRRPSTAALADRVAYMEAGRIVATGTHDELWETLPAYREAITAGGTVDTVVGQVHEEAVR